jgi:hypothetical protein
MKGWILVWFLGRTAGFLLQLFNSVAPGVELLERMVVY